MEYIYTIDYTNAEENTISVRIQTFDDPLGEIPLQGSGEPNLAPTIMESVNNDDDKTNPLRSKRIRMGFNSGEYDLSGTDTVIDARTFSGDELFRAVIICGGVSVPFIGDLTIDDNSEAFQPRPNPVQLTASDGLNSLRDVELRTLDDALPVGHYSIIEYISMCLSRLTPGQQTRVVMNLYEKSRLRFLSANFNITAPNVFRIPYEHLGFLEIGDTIEITNSTLGNNGSYTITDITEVAMVGVDIEVSTSTFVLETTEVYIFRSSGHTFSDIYLDANRFKKDDSSMIDCLTVLTWILEAFGCFISYDHDGWYIIRWDEYDGQSAISTMKAAYFDTDTGAFGGYEDLDLNKVIASDYDPLYEGYRLSQDNAIRRFQRKANKVAHIYNFTQIDVPCNKDFTQGAVDDDVLPLKTYEVDCWTTLAGFGANAEAPTTEARIWRRYDDNGNESERYLVLTPPGVASERNYVVSEGIPITENDKFVYSFGYSADSDNSEAGPYALAISAITLHGTDGSIWILGDNQSGPGTDIVPEWKLSNADHSVNADYFFWYISGSEDLTAWNNYEIESPPAPVDGDVFIHFFAANQLGLAIENFAIRYNNVKFTYIPYIDGTYGSLIGQSVKVSSDNGSKRVIEKEMFISDSPKKLFKGAMKKFDGTNYVLTETWNYYNDLTVLPDQKLSKFIVYQWWNQFRKHRTVIESDFQGINSDQEFGIPGLIHRWKINHEDESNKYWMLTSLRDLNFRTCGWAGVLVETSDADGDRSYDDTFEFKYIQ